MDPFVIVGAGTAGYMLIKEIRKLNGNIPIILVTQDDGDYYSKPMLSNLLSKKQSVECTILNYGKKAALAFTFELYSNCQAQSIDTKNKILKTNQGDIIYEKLILACGASSRKLPLD